jgi:two-component system LytT family response regulator
MRTLIVDHEPCVRETLRNLCEADDGIDEVTEAESGVAALKMIRAKRPDLLLLDVELSDMTGFDVTTPISADRFATAIKRVRERRASLFAATRRQAAADTQNLFDTGEPRRGSPARLIGENAHRLYFLAVDEVDYIESCGNYVLIHVGAQKYVRRDTLKRLASELQDAEFEWIRRSTLINLARVAFAEKLDHGALAFTLTSGTRLVSRAGIRLAATRGRTRIENVE